MPTHQQPKIGDVWYRYDDKVYASIDPETDVSYFSSPQLEVTTYMVTKVTPKGVWVKRFWGAPEKFNPDAQFSGAPSFVLLGEGKRKVHATKELALRSLLARKTRQASLYAAGLKRAEYAKNLAKYELSKLCPAPAAIRATEEALLPA